MKNGSCFLGIGGGVFVCVCMCVVRYCPMTATPPPQKKNTHTHFFFYFILSRSHFVENTKKITQWVLEDCLDGLEQPAVTKAGPLCVCVFNTACLKATISYFENATVSISSLSTHVSFLESTSNIDSE